MIAAVESDDGLAALLMLAVLGDRIDELGHVRSPKGAKQNLLFWLSRKQRIAERSAGNNYACFSVGLTSGRHWIRTSDLCRVKAAL